MATLGDSCSDRTAFTVMEGYTLNTLYSFPTAGLITSFCIYPYYDGTHTTTTAKLKVFRTNGSSFDYVGQSESFTVNCGSTNTCTLASPLTVSAGDTLGLSMGTYGWMETDSGEGGSKYRKLGDIVANSLISTWLIVNR
ncbi:Uncharacterised protein [uncultured archaeon]|nr:Uncharacterised protein [uncultured archaeon]